MFFKNPKSFIVRFVLILTMLGGMPGVMDVQASSLGVDTTSILVTVQDTDGLSMVGLNVYAFNGATYAGVHGITTQSGQVSLGLPLGSYRFRADLNGTQFWSGTSNHCDIPGCVTANVTVSKPVTVTVLDTDGAPKASLNVYAFNGSAYTGYNKATNADGQAIFTLPLGSYRFRADLNGTQLWSGASNHCDIPGCGSAGVTVSKPVTVTILDTNGVPKAGLNVYAFNGSTYTSYNKTTNADGQAVFTLPLGSYRFRADLNGTQFWSGTANHCSLPGCESMQLIVTIPVTVTVQDGGGTPKSGVNVYAFNGSAYTSYSKVSDASGQAVFTLPLGSYRFRADYYGTQYWSGATNHCTLPGCLTASVTVGPVMTSTSTATSTATYTPTYTPTFTPTITSTPILGCGSIRDQFVGIANPIKLYKKTMYLDINNPNPYSVTVDNVFVRWNYSWGSSMGGELSLQSVQLSTTVFWMGNISTDSFVIDSFSAPVVIPPGSSRITFNFNQTYANPRGEELQIGFSTPGCEAYPIHVSNQ